MSGQEDISAISYVDHARAINAIARDALRLETRDASSLAAKVSLGLSLQAAELAGKAILVSLGQSLKNIRKKHAKHNLLALLREAQRELRDRREKELQQYGSFLCHTHVIDGRKVGTTTGMYLEKHFSHGRSADPRSYFYPDEGKFTGPVPIHALLIITDDLIDVAEKVVTLAASP